MDITSYRQQRAYAAQYGFIVGLIWIASFSLFIIGLTQPLMGNLSLLVGILSIAATGYLVRKFRHEVAPLRFWHTWWMATQIFMYASLLMAAAQFIYFRYIDNGLLVDTYASIMQQPEAVAMLQSMMPGENVEQVGTEVIGLLQSISPIQLTFEFLIYNLMSSFIFAFPAAWIGKSGKTPASPSQNQ